MSVNNEVPTGIGGNKDNHLIGAAAVKVLNKKFMNF